MLLLACAPAPSDDPLVLTLEWLPSGEETWKNAEGGLWWALSNLGPDPGDRAALQVEVEAETVVFTLDLGAVGFSERALASLEEAVAPLAEDAPVDVARFLLATLYEPGRYYAITGACTTIDSWRASLLDEDPLLYAVTSSLLTDGDRRVRFNPAEVYEGLAWEAAEGEGSLAAGDFEAVEHEVVDLMPNGQFRYAVYGEDGGIQAASATTAAGQPGRCMWCHEVTLQRGTSENASADGYLSYEAFLAEVGAAEALVAGRRAASILDYEDYSLHEQAEELTRSFLEPSASRVALEWAVSRGEVQAEGLATHVSSEFPERGELYMRDDVDAARMARDPSWSPPAHAPDDRVVDPERPLGDVPGCE